MQYQDYTISYQLNREDKTLFIKVINSIMFQSYETTIIKNNFKYKLEIVKNILDNCLTNKDINLKFNVFSKQLQIICLYKTEIFDFEFEIGLDEVEIGLDEVEIGLDEVETGLAEIKNVELIDLNKRIYKLENKIKIYEEQTPIVFQAIIIQNVLNDNFNKRLANSYSFYNKAQLICTNEVFFKIKAFINKLENNLVANIKQRYDRIRTYMICADGFINGYNQQQIIIPPGKILKVWNNDNLKPTIYTHGIYNGIPLGVMFWLGSEEYKDDIPEDFRLFAVGYVTGL